MNHVNVIGDIDPRLWERQSLGKVSSEYIFHYRNFKSDAQWSIYLGNANCEFIPNPQSTNIFMLVEPPEVHEYKHEYLAKFDLIAGPKFPQYIELPNYLFSQCALPWSIGVSFQDTKMDMQSRLMRKLPGRLRGILKQDAEVSFDLAELLEFNLKKENRLSVVTSSKSDTPMQKQRINFINFLQKRRAIPLDVYGRGFKPVRDKFEVLSNSTHHLALENSSHIGNWTEKLADPILSLNRTYYVGAPDISEYFSHHAVLPLDLSNFEKAAETIEKDFLTIKYNESTLEKARTKLIYEYSFESIILRMLKTQKATNLVK
jgi:hypothetical protein